MAKARLGMMINHQKDSEMIASYVGRWSQAQHEQLQLCETIDQAAERLPLHEVEALGLLAGQIVMVMDRVQSFEEQNLFPLLEAVSPQMRPLLITFRSHHSRDRAAATAIADLLAAQLVLTTDYLQNLKLRLESFSESLRRHVQFEGAITMALFASKRVDERRAVQ